MFSRLRQAISVLRSIFNGVGNRHIGLIAAGVAFYGLLAIFPAITAIVTLWGFMADPDIVEQQLQSYKDVFPDAAFSIIDAQVRSIANGPKQVLGWASMLSIAAALWATRAGVSAMVGGLNAVHNVPPRGGLRSIAVALLLTFVLVGVALVALGTVVVAPIVVSFLPLGAFTGFALDAVRWLIGVGVMLLGIGLLYRLGPNRADERSQWVSPGSVLAIVLWGLVSFGFSKYLANFSNYNEIYGSLGAVIALLMWFYLSAFVVMLGALVNAELEQRTRPFAPLVPAEDELPDTPDTAHHQQAPSQ